MSPLRRLVHRVFFFSRVRVRRLMQSAGFPAVRVRALTNIFFAVDVR